MEDPKTHQLVLYNDQENDFLYVIACLIKYCNHNPLQAEQCATIAHHKGKYAVKFGNFSEILELKSNFERLSLKAEIESYESNMH
jgi:ATP-dependent Clp protease adaptor protein ClpS